MLRTSLVGVTKTLSARVRETGGVLPATLYPAYVKADSGTFNYEDLTNKPSINGITLLGDVSLEAVGIAQADQAEIDALFEEI